MIVHTCISKKYVISQEEETTLEEAAKILDKLYANSQENGKWEENFLKAEEDLKYLLESLELNEKYTYWSEEVSEDSISEQG